MSLGFLRLGKSCLLFASSGELISNKSSTLFRWVGLWVRLLRQKLRKLENSLMLLEVAVLRASHIMVGMLKSPYENTVGL